MWCFRVLRYYGCNQPKTLTGAKQQVCSGIIYQSAIDGHLLRSSQNIECVFSIELPKRRFRRNHSLNACYFESWSCCYTYYFSYFDARNIYKHIEGHSAEGGTVAQYKTSYRRTKRPFSYLSKNECPQ